MTSVMEDTAMDSWLRCWAGAIGTLASVSVSAGVPPGQTRK